MNIINYASRFPFDAVWNEMFKHNDLNPLHRKPAVNIQETATSYKLELVVPGLTKEEIEISLDKDLLTIKGSNKKESQENQENKYLRRDFNGLVFDRSFHLPQNIDTDKIQATYEQGILVVDLPKVVEVHKEKKLIAFS